MRSPAVPEVVPEVPQAPESAVVAAQVAAGTSAVIPRLVSSGLRFALGDRHACAIIVRRDGVVDAMDMDGGRFIYWPFAGVGESCGAE